MAEVKVVLTGEDNLTKPVGRAAQAIRQIQESYLLMAGKIAIAYAGLQKALDFGRVGAVALQAEESFRNVTSAYGVDGEKLIASMKKVSNSVIDDSDLMQKSVKLLQQGLSADQIVSIMEVARSSSRIAGISVAEAMDRIGDATASQMPRALKSMGLVIDQAKAQEEYAKKIGVSKDALTEMQQTQALTNAVIEEGQRQMKAMGDITENASERFQRGAAHVHEMKEAIGKGMVIAIYALTGALQWGIQQFMLLQGHWASFKATLLEKSPFEADRKAAEALRFEASAYFKEAEIHGKKSVEIFDSMSVVMESIGHQSGKAAEGLKGIAKSAQDASTQAANTKRMNELYAEWNAKVQALNPNLDESALKLIEIDRWLSELRAKNGNLKIFDDLERQAKAFVEEGIVKEFDKAMVERFSGLQKELIEEQRLFLDNVRKFGQTEERRTAITDLHARKRIDAIGKYAKEGTQKEIDSLNQWRQYFSQAYDLAIAKVDELRQRRQAASTVGDDIRKFLADYNARPLSPVEQMEKDRKGVLQQMRDAGREWNLELMQQAAEAGKNFLSKYKGTVSSLGFTQDFKDVQNALKDIASRTDSIAYEAQRGEVVWESYANRALNAVHEIDNRLLTLESRILSIDWYLQQMHEFKISTVEAETKLELLWKQLSSINDLLGKAGGGSASPTPPPEPAHIGRSFVSETGLVPVLRGEAILNRREAAERRNGGSNSGSVTFANTYQFNGADNPEQLARQIDEIQANMWQRKTSRLRSAMEGRN